MPKSRIFNVANMSFKAVREIEILAKISEFTVFRLCVTIVGIVQNIARVSYFIHLHRFTL